MLQTILVLKFGGKFKLIWGDVGTASTEGTGRVARPERRLGWKLTNCARV